MKRLASISKTPKKRVRRKNAKGTVFKSNHKLVELLKMKGYEGRELARKKNIEL